MKTLTFLSIVFCLSTFQITAQLYLDTTFQHTGIVPTTLPNTTIEAVSKLQSDGKIVVLTISVGGKHHLTRFLINGELDSTFGFMGIIDSVVLNASDMEIQSDDKIVLGGRGIGSGGSNPSNKDFGLARYLSNGTLDSSFGNNGIVITETSTSKAPNPSVRLDYINAINILGNGKILAVGYADGPSWSVGPWSGSYKGPSIRRYLPTGNIDTTFTLPLYAPTDSVLWQSVIFGGDGGDFGVSDVIGQPDGKVLVGGTTANLTNPFGTGPDPNRHMGFGRFNVDGTIDSTFGGNTTVNGSQIIRWNSQNDKAFFVKMLLLSNGSILGLGSFVDSNGIQGIGLTRLLANGKTDSSFGNNGIIFNTLNGTAPKPSDIAMLPSGKMLISGNNGIADFFIGRFNADGSLDTACQAVITTTDLDTNDVASNIQIQSNGKVLLSGSASGDLVLLRYNLVPSLDTSVTRNGATFTANDTTAKYQWLDCSSMQALPGDTNQTFTATANGSYAVAVSKNGCTDTSGCYTITNVGLMEMATTKLEIYPNPNSGSFSIEFEEITSGTLEIYTISGQRVYAQNIQHQEQLKLNLPLAKGIYQLKLSSKKQHLIQPLIIQ